MVFSSVVFLFRFLPLFFILYYLAPKRMKNFILFLGSLFFYAWGEPVYVLLMLFSTIVDYTHGRMLERLSGKRAAKCVLLSSVLINLLVLCFFKYADFLIKWHELRRRLQEEMAEKEASAPGIMKEQNMRFLHIFYEEPYGPEDFYGQFAERLKRGI